VLDSYWCVPVRPDHHGGALDLKKIGRTRLTGTLLLKWIYQIHWISFGLPGLKERELTELKLGFRRVLRRGLPGGQRRRAPGGLRDDWRCGRGEEEDGEPVGLIGDVEIFLW
jgi:hypothetical protein